MTAAAAALVLPRQAIADDNYVREPYVGSDTAEEAFLQPPPGGEFDTLFAVGEISTVPFDINRRFSYSDFGIGFLLPGPTYRLQPGGNLSLKYTNALPEGGVTAAYTTRMNTTNLHFHGLHVSPLSDGGVSGNDADGSPPGQSSDDVLVELEPNSLTHIYDVHIPADHAPGTHWYHPHVHGSTAVQVINGMAGAIIIDEPNDDQPLSRLPPEQDFIWVIQEVGEGSGIYSTGNKGNIGQELLVNGQRQPNLTIDSNQMCRLRFINATATPGGFITLIFEEEIGDNDYQQIVSQPIPPDPSPGDLEDCRGFYRIAVDGISHYGMAPVAIDRWDMSPGNRADFLVRLDAGHYRVRIEPNLTLQGGGYRSAPRVDCLETECVLAKITVNNVDGPPTPELPDCINRPPSWGPDHYLSPFLDECCPDVSQTIEFSTDPSIGKGKINGQAYDDDNVPEFNVGIDTEEIWELKHVGGGSAHPFHIHVNPFQVIEIDENPNHPYKNIWFDTFFVRKGQSVKIRHRFKDYVGKFVFHCHILIHEDNGMMRNINITGCGKGPDSNGGMINWPDNGTQADPCPGGVELST
jgi:FtsP/CotA-like multicopper oxidase with cupredoxin domain